MKESDKKFKSKIYEEKIITLKRFLVWYNPQEKKSLQVKMFGNDQDLQTMAHSMESCIELAEKIGYAKKTYICSVPTKEDENDSWVKDQLLRGRQKWLKQLVIQIVKMGEKTFCTNLDDIITFGIDITMAKNMTALLYKFSEPNHRQSVWPVVIHLEDDSSLYLSPNLIGTD